MAIHSASNDPVVSSENPIHSKCFCCGQFIFVFNGTVISKTLQPRALNLKIARSLTIDKPSYFKKYYKFWLRSRASVSLPPPGANDFDLSRNTKRCEA